MAPDKQVDMLQQQGFSHAEAYLIEGGGLSGFLPYQPSPGRCCFILTHPGCLAMTKTSGNAANCDQNGCKPCTASSLPADASRTKKKHCLLLLVDMYMLSCTCTFIPCPFRPGLLARVLNVHLRMQQRVKMLEVAHLSITPSGSAPWSRVPVSSGPRVLGPLKPRSNIWMCGLQKPYPARAPGRSDLLPDRGVVRGPDEAFCKFHDVELLRRRLRFKKLVSS